MLTAMPLQNLQPIESKLPEDKHIQYVSDDDMLTQLEDQLREEAANIKKRGQPSNYYINNKELCAEICACKVSGQLSNKLIHMFELLIKHVQRRLYYRDKDLQADVAAEAMLILASKWQMFDPTVTQNAFSWATSVILNGMARGWNIQSKPGIHIPIDSLFQSGKHD